MSEPSGELRFSIKHLKHGFLITDAEGDAYAAKDTRDLASILGNLLGQPYMDEIPLEPKILTDGSETAGIIAARPEPGMEKLSKVIPTGNDTPLILNHAQMRQLGVRPIDRSNMRWKGPPKTGVFKHPRCGHISTRHETGNCGNCRVQFCSVCNTCLCS